MTTFNADSTPLPFCPEDGNHEDAKISIAYEILDKLTPVKDRARDIANALRLRHSLLTKPYTLENVIDNWLDQNYDTNRYGLPCWNTLLTAVAEPNGGANKALAKRLAAIYKPGVHSVEPSIPKTKLSAPKQESVHRSESPPQELPSKSQPDPSHSSSSSAIVKPIMEETSDESSIDTTTTGSSSFPSSSTTTSSSSQLSSSEPSSSGISSSESSNTSSTNSSCPPSTFDSSSNMSSGTACSEGSSYASSTPRGSEGFNVSDIPPTSGYPPSGYLPSGYPATRYPPSGYPPQQHPPDHPPQADHQTGRRPDDEEDYHHEEASDTGSSTSSAMVPLSMGDNQNFPRESDIAEDGLLPSLGKKHPVSLSDGANDKPSGLLSYAVAQGNCRGYALIINNIRIDGREERQGAQHDGSKLSKTLKSLRYKLVGNKVHENCTAFRMRQLFEEAMAIDHSQHDSFICCLLSHGDTDYIYGTDDQKVWLKDLGKDVTKCKSLIGRPKIFFIQACRGTLLPDARRVQVDDDGILQGRVLLPEACDVFFGYATSPDTKACRFTNAGSWYIIELCRALEQYPHEDLMTIVQIAQYNVCTKKEYHYTRDENGTTKTYRQSPQIVSTLIKKFYFH